MNALSEALAAWWFDLPASAQDLVVLAACLAPHAGRGAAREPRLPRLAAGARAAAPSPPRERELRRAGGRLGRAQASRWSRSSAGVRQASARAADPFDLIVAAPGSEVTALLATVYLQPENLPLLSRDVYVRLAARDGVALAAPLAFGDSVAGRPLVGTTAALVEHLGGAPREGRVFRKRRRGRRRVGERLRARRTPAPDARHGRRGRGARARGRRDDRERCAGAERHAVGPRRDRPARDGVDRARARQRAPGGGGGSHRSAVRPGAHAGVTAVVVRAETLAGTYALRSAFTASDSMAFFPGEVLARLHGLLSDVRRVLSGMALLTEVLVVTAVALALAILLAGFARRFAMLRALGAPRGFVFAVAWLHGLSTIIAGALIGVPLGQLVAFALGWLLARESAVAVRPLLGTADLSLVALFVLCGALLIALPAWRLSGRRAMADLRA